MTDPAAIAAAAELREKIRKTIERDPDQTVAELAARFECHKSSIYNHLRAIREEADIVDAVVDEDTVPKERRMATKKQSQGGGQDADQVKALELACDQYAEREKELLERSSNLTARFINALERIEQLEAEIAAATAGEG